VTVDRDGVVVVAGELDLAGVQVLRRWLCDTGSVTALDLGAVTFIDAAGLRCLDELEGVVVRRASPAVRRLLAIVGEPNRYAIAP
jgi:anti-anti-sigma regulatory factor